MKKPIWIILVLVALITIIAYFVINSDDKANSYSEGNGNPEQGENASGIINGRIDEGGSTLGIKVVPLLVIEDSRCPTDVTCIQAGIVKLQALVNAPAGNGEYVFVLDVPQYIGEHAITLVSVTPAPVSTQPIEVSQYNFQFKVEKGR